MIPIPDTSRRFLITNKSDTSGNIWYTKNVNLDEQGYVRLSPRNIAIYSSSQSNDFDIVASFGRYRTSYRYLLGDAGTYPFTADISPTGFTVAVDAGTGVPATGVTAGRGVFWQQRWYMTAGTTGGQVYWKNLTTGAWTSLGLTLTDNILRPLCVFESYNYLAVGNGSTVQLVDTSHTLVRTLTIPSDYEVSAIAYSNDKLGMVAKIKVDSIHETLESKFITWDGATTSANGIYSVGSDEVLEVVAYKSSFVFLTRAGQLLYFNGGGFQELAVVPYYVRRRIMSIGRMIGDTMKVDGEKIYINVAGSLIGYGKKQESFLQNYNQGILCYDPNIGLYNVYSPSISLASAITVTSGNINTTTDILTKTAGTLPQTGNPIKLIAGQPGGLKNGFVYYIIRRSTTTFSLATTRENAIAGTAIDITSTGSASNYFLALDLTDYGQSLVTTAGGIVLNDSRDYTYDQMLLSSTCTGTSGTDISYAQLVISEFTNIGYYVTSRIMSQAVNDTFQSVFVKYAPLKSDDVITVKCKYENISGIPTTTPQGSTTCTWIDSNTLTTTADFSEVLTYLSTSGNECECEIISGAGAGQMSKISSITYDTGTYTINLTDDLEGITAGNICNIIVDNWKTLGTITSTDTNGWKQFPIAKSAKWIKLKVEMKGTNIVVEDLQIVNKEQIPAL